jgi:hypothetical protein
MCEKSSGNLDFVIEPRGNVKTPALRTALGIKYTAAYIVTIYKHTQQ